jgi:hypothetical protein
MASRARKLDRLRIESPKPDETKISVNEALESVDLGKARRRLSPQVE